MAKFSVKTHKKTTIALGVFGGVALVVLLLLAMSGTIAAHLAQKELKAMGFEPQGLDSLEVDWWSSQIRLSQVSLARANQAPLGIESLMLHYDLGALWDRRILIHRVDIGGIDVSVVREADGGIRLNDVALPMGGEAAAPQEEDTGEPWLPGLDQLTLENSRIQFTDVASGVNAQVRLDKVSLMDFFGWHPGQAGQYEVAAQINGMDLQVSGTAKPFAGAIEVESAGRLSGITFERLNSLAPLPDVGPLKAGAALNWDVQVQLGAGAALALNLKSDLSVEGLEAAYGEGAVLAKLAKLSLDDVAVVLTDQNGLAVDIARIGGEGLDVSLTEKITALSPPPQSESSDEPSSDAMPVRINVGLVELDANSRIAFSDGSLHPPFKTQFEFDTLRVENIATADPDQAMDVDLQGKINQFAPVAVKGWVKPLADKLSLDVTASVKTLELPPFSPYAAKAVGMHLDGGRVAVDGTGKINAGQLDAKMDIGLDKLAFTPLSEDDRKKLSDTVGMPVDTVVGLLEDGDGHIGITLPISGDMDQPAFDLSDAINQAVGGAVKAAAGGIFKVLFPPAALISLIAEAEDGSVSFKPAMFPAGQAELSAETKTHADQLAMVMKERPKLGIRMCGRTTGVDQSALMAKMLEGAEPKAGEQVSEEDKQAKDKEVLAALEEMAVSRTRNAKQYLIEKHAIAPERLAECRSFFDAKDTEAPRLEVTF